MTRPSAGNALVAVAGHAVEPHTTMDGWLTAATATPAGVEQLRANNRTHSENKKKRHTDGTRDSYDRWWKLFGRWLTDPARRVRGRALPAATVEMALDPTDSRGEALLLMWLYELTYGPEDSQAAAEWREEFGYISPNTFNIAVAAIKARCEDELGHRPQFTTDTETALTGCRQELRKHYGPDVQATPLLGIHIRTIVSYLHRARPSWRSDGGGCTLRW
ncbi:hypothetical protein NHL50_11290 [Acidimicrobiia bacterium EGI L10123]|uniref:hypothetical protein n=1 Tax=Salinilacustrithrix flava TaxID=2957203 RepID=UPI003D7C16B0|nr:hypothetical protein [Acidimicrobiia bacterium EGI L10123]